ncbi:ABC transporter ATP-binding protein [Agrococcus sp. HG114]|uniref:ABC transporter ATP-binding protein n=1 Tax=Agrococcus sp. HG114 TaxID=2969757 RepID=UPI00215A6D1B|nr:ABC transporter ATP-binding protein [Agrococcus sp. HG114]MCR8671385.1 ABC transporter ATP-binding protein [Agrococcus sp. HG114]
MTAIATTDLAKHYAEVRALDGVTLSLEEHRIHGLLGRNGAGKTTLMKLLTGQVFATSGEMRVLGADPVENVEVLSRTAFIQESQKYPDTFRPVDVLRIAAGAYPHWDQALADRLVERFALPEKRRIKKLSRGQLSAIGIVVGLASRAPLTFFDEPYLGLDAVARRMFYDELLADFSEHPRTIVLSTHHIDEVANLLEHVVILDRGRVLLDADTDELQGAALTVSGRTADVDAFLAGRDPLERTTLGSLATATIAAADGDEQAARDAGLDIAPVSLQALFVHLTTADASATDPATAVAHA